MKDFTTYTYGNMDAPVILVQAVDDHDMEVIDSEIEQICQLTGKDFGLRAIKVNDWNRDLSPWEAPPVFGKEPFGGEAEETLESVLALIEGYHDKKFYIGGYSLAALFALWAATKTDIFEGVAAASPSVWFPGFSEYLETAEIKTKSVYLSLGDREEKTRNQVMARVGDCIRAAETQIANKGIPCTLEWNEGNHFRDADIRTAKGFAWVLNI